MISINVTRRKTINFCFGFATFFVFHLLKACDFEEESLPPEVATPEKPAISPSKKYFLIVIKQTSDLSLYFEILEEKSKKNIHSSKALFASRFTTFFCGTKMTEYGFILVI